MSHTPPPPLVEPRSLDLLRLIVINLSLILLVACGGGGSGGSSTATMTPTTGNPNTPPTGGDDRDINPLADLANFMPTTDSSIQDIQNITSTTGAVIDTSDVFESGSLNTASDTNCVSIGCTVTLQGTDTTATLLKDNLTDISLITNNRYFSDSSYSSEITNGVPIEGITFARGKLTGTRAADSSPLEFETFTGWLDGSVFGVTQVKIGASDGNELYRFFTYNVGVYDSATSINPTATGSETTSATWEGATVASIKASREFIFGEATITANFMDTNVDLEFDNWRDLDNQELSNMDAITYQDAEFANGRFSLRRNNITEAFGRFYGTDHAEVGGWFNTEDVTGSFGGTRQTGQ